MKLVASMICRNEADRYLQLAIDALLEFCDGVRIVDDASTDETFELVSEIYSSDQVQIAQLSSAQFYGHEGRARQALLNWTLAAAPTHILAIDADEFVTDGAELRRQLEEEPAHVHSLCMEEVWTAERDGYMVRCDGGWRPHEVPIAFPVPGDLRGQFEQTATRRAAQGYVIADRKLACGREPLWVRRQRVDYSAVSVLHFGWAREAERVARHARYVEHDGGSFHARRHLDSILWSPPQVELDARPPARFAAYPAVVERVNRR